MILEILNHTYQYEAEKLLRVCLLYTSDAADD